MNQVSLIAATLAISAQCFTVARAVEDLCFQYNFANESAAAIRLASKSVISSLEAIRTLALGSSTNKILGLQELDQGLDVTLTGCALIYSILENVVVEHVRQLRDGEDEIRQRAEPYLDIWKTEVIKQGIQELQERKVERDFRVGVMMQAQLQHIKDLNLPLSLLTRALKM